MCLPSADKITFYHRLVDVFLRSVFYLFLKLSFFILFFSGGGFCCKNCLFVCLHAHFPTCLRARACPFFISVERISLFLFRIGDSIPFTDLQSYTTEMGKILQ